MGVKARDGNTKKIIYLCGLKIILNSKMGSEKIKCLIIGSGPAGYTAAIYASRANISPVLYEGIQPGGQLTTTTEIDNFPGYPTGTSGQEMMEDLKKQAIRFGTDVRFGIVSKVDLSERPFKVIVDEENEIIAETIIISTGATAKYLGIESEEKFRGQGVSACATCDGFFYKGKDVAVVGGGDTACEEASYLAGLCNKVYLIVRRDVLRASKAMQDRVKNTSNIEILWNYNTKEIVGTPMGGVNGAILAHKNGTEKKIDIHGFFLAIGHHPNSELFSEWIKTNEEGYIITEGKSSKTNVPGVFAAGDVQDPNYRQAITAAGSGCMAALDAERFLSDNK
jgi:thioredoxin reductase (NADPH)